MSGYHAITRAAAVALMQEAAYDAGVKMQVYRARPASIHPPTGFVEGVDETITEFTITRGAHFPRVTLTFLWGSIDSGDAVDQRDAFVDAFYELARAEYHAISTTSLIGPTAITDIPAYTPDWLPQDAQRTYYATQVILEAYGSD